MPRFFVYVKQVITYQLEVVADDAEDAEKLVQDGIDRWLATEEDMNITQELPGDLVDSQQHAEIYDPDEEDEDDDESDDEDEDEAYDDSEDEEAAEDGAGVGGRDDVDFNF